MAVYRVHCNLETLAESGKSLTDAENAKFTTLRNAFLGSYFHSRIYSQMIGSNPVQHNVQ